MKRSSKMRKEKFQSFLIVTAAIAFVLGWLALPFLHMDDVSSRTKKVEVVSVADLGE